MVLKVFKERFYERPIVHIIIPRFHVCVTEEYYKELCDIMGEEMAVRTVVSDELLKSSIIEFCEVNE